MSDKPSGKVRKYNPVYVPPTKKPFNIIPMRVEAFIADEQALEVTSSFIKEPSSNNLHPDGLFSEEIFGQIGSTDRLSRFGFIDHRTKIIAPLFFKNLMKLKKYYLDIISGAKFARYDEHSGDFVLCESDEKGAGTGYQFFLDKLPLIQFALTESSTRQDKVDLITKFSDRMLNTKLPVMPAAMREIKLDEPIVAVEELNKKYQSVLMLARSLPEKGATEPVYDFIRYSLQRKINDIYDYIFNMIEGKRGFAQSKVNARSVAYGTRNVISASDMSGLSHKDPRYIKYDDALCPLFQTLKAFQPKVCYMMRTALASIFAEGAINVALVDKKTMKLHYQQISDKERSKFMSTDGIKDLIKTYRGEHFRFSPVEVEDSKGKRHYLNMIYEDGAKIFLFRDIDSFREKYTEHFKKDLDPNLIRPMNYTDMFYMFAYEATRNEYITVTRYPVTSTFSIQYMKCRLQVTNVDKAVEVYDMNGPTISVSKYERYPIYKANFKDALSMHSAKLKQFGGDFDGDTVNTIGILIEDAREQVEGYLNDPRNDITASGKLAHGSATDLINLSFHNICRTPDEGLITPNIPDDKLDKLIDDLTKRGKTHILTPETYYVTDMVCDTTFDRKVVIVDIQDVENVNDYSYIDLMAPQTIKEFDNMKLKILTIVIKK